MRQSYRLGSNTPFLKIYDDRKIGIRKNRY